MDGSHVVSKDAKDSTFLLFLITRHKNLWIDRRFHIFWMFQLEDTKENRMNECLFFLRCFLLKGPLLYQGLPKIQSLFYFSISKYENNVD